MNTLNDLTDYAEPLQPNAMDIRTEYLEPITSSTYKYTFRLDQSGYLDTNSMIVWKPQAKARGGTATDNILRHNMWNGALGGIKRVIFQVGDNIINDVQDVWKYATLKNANMPSSMRNGFLGHYLGNSLFTDTMESAGEAPDRDSAVQVNPYNTETGGRVGSINMNHAKSGFDGGARADGAGSQICSMPIGYDTATNHQVGIRLGTLIPALAGQKIPLFLFDKQRILLTFEFNTAEKYVNSLVPADIAYNGAGEGWASAGDVIPTNVQLVVDYIVMPSDAQNELLAQTQKEGGYRLEFYDVVNVEKNIPAGANNSTQEVEHRIGQNNREVHNILMWKETVADAVGATGSKHGCIPFGRYQKCQGFSREQYNCNIDGRDEFDHFVYSPVAQYNELSNALGADLQVVRPQYCCDENTASSQLATLESGLLGTMKPLGLSLRNGEPVLVGGGRQIGNYPIIWKWKRDCHNAILNNHPRDDQTVKCNYFCEVSRVANILNTGKGMSVVVSY